MVSVARLIRFLMVGGSGSFAYILLSYFLLQTVKEPWLSSFIAYAFLIPIVYMLQRRFVFRSKEPYVKSFFRYLAIQLFGLTLSAIIPYVLSLYAVNPLVSFMLVVLIVPLLSYILQACWAF